ncbi:MAG: hypothetical protein K2O06_16405 [Acetatifactor sp.]|nr:hypothetical protein [Acetatifactor sp.]
MATKLKNLKIRKVDFVDEGANPDAHIRMLKRRDGETQTAEEDSKKGTGSILKRLFGFIGKAAGMNQEEIDSAIDEIQKGDSLSFNEKINEVKNYKIADEMWDTCYALQSSLCSILNDEELDSTGAATAMQESLDEFYAVVQESIKEWSSGKSASIVRKSEEVSEAELEIMKSAVERLNETIEKACKDAKKEKSEENGPNNNENPKGDEEEMGMKIDKSKLTDAERAFLESIEKRYGVEEGDVSGSGNTAAAPAEQTPASAEQTVTKSAPEKNQETPVGQEDGQDNIYKGLHPAVRAELEGLRKFREDAEARELTEVAKRYAIIGKTEAELVPLFKSLRAAGGTAYNDMIAVLDQAVDTVEKSGAFTEIGKSGHGSGAVGAAEAKVEAIAKGYMEKDSSLDYASAMAKAWEDNPELMAEYEAEAGF